MSPQDAAVMLGGRARGNSVSCPGPGHAADDNSLTVIFTPEGFVVHTFSTADDWKECKDYVRSKLGIADNWKPDPAKLKPSSDMDNDRKFQHAMDLWSQTQPITGTIVERYLASRAIILPTEISSLRYHHRLKYDNEFYPSMVCLYRDILTNEPRGVHRTFLSPAGDKIDRMMLASAKGCAIKLDDDETVTMGITIGEGVETCLSARQVGYAPTWALMSANGIAAFPVLDGVDAITFLGERDENRTNEMACKAAARRWLMAERDVHIHMPVVGKDFNDALRSANGK